MPWAWPGEFCTSAGVHGGGDVGVAGVDGVGGHDGGPFGPFGVADHDGDGTAKRLPMSNTRQHGDLVGLEFHARSPAISEAAAG